MSGLEPAFDAKAQPSLCDGCGQRVVKLVFAGERDPACPICRGREASARALEEGAVPAGPWPRLVLRRGAPLAGGALACAVPGSEALLEAEEGALARLRREGDRLSFAPLVAGARLGTAEVAVGAEVELSRGARVSIAGRELVRA